MTQQQVKAKLKELRRLSSEYAAIVAKSRTVAMKAASIKTKIVKIYASIPEDERIMHKDELTNLLRKGGIE